MPEYDSTVSYKEVKDFPNYVVGTDGTIWSKRDTGYGLVKPSGKKYKKVWLCPGRKCVNVHTLVLETFVGPCPNGMQACHFPDRDKGNNALCNLRWGTPEENQYDRVLHGTDSRGEKNYNTRLTEDDVRHIRFMCSKGIRGTQVRLAEKYGISKYAISLIHKRKNWAHVV